MAERIADQRPALEHEIGREKGADAPDQGRNPHGVDHVVVVERQQQVLDHLLSTGSDCLVVILPFSPYMTSGRSSSVSTEIWRGSSSSWSPAPASTKWRRAPPKVSSSHSRVKISEVGPEASTVPLTSTVRSQNSGTEPRLWVETSITLPSSRK